MGEASHDRPLGRAREGRKTDTSCLRLLLHGLRVPLAEELLLVLEGHGVDRPGRVLRRRGDLPGPGPEGGELAQDPADYGAHVCTACVEHRVDERVLLEGRPDLVREGPGLLGYHFRSTAKRAMSSRSRSYSLSPVQSTVLSMVIASVTSVWATVLAYSIVL